MRNCPVCHSPSRDKIFSMTYCVPDGFTLPNEITWYTCGSCGFLYGDGDFDQSMLNQYYRERYGYGVNSSENIKRLQTDALSLSTTLKFKRDALIVDFGGAGDDGRSVLVDTLRHLEYTNAFSVGAGDELPQSCKVIYASHVIEHIYNLPETMRTIVNALSPDGLLIIDVPDATGLLLEWKMPILDFNTKHLNHFTLLHLLELGKHYGLEAVSVRPYKLGGAPAYQVQFSRLNMAHASKEHIQSGISERLEKLREIKEPVNIWGLGDVTWHLLSMVDLDVLDYIDNDPAFRDMTYKGKPILERPTNDAPIVILAQGQRSRLIKNIRDAGIENSIIEI